jgi:hypothetical protein
MWLSYARATVVSIDRLVCDTFASSGLVRHHARLPNEQDLVRRAAAWRTRSVERNRCVQATAVWGLQDAAVGWRAREGALGAREAGPARAAWAGRDGDWVLATMAERVIWVNAAQPIARGSRLGRCALDVQEVTAAEVFMVDDCAARAVERGCRSGAASRCGRRGSVRYRCRARAGRRRGRTRFGWAVAQDG